MRKKKRGPPHRRTSTEVPRRSARVRHEDFAALRAEAMDSVLTPAELAVWDKTHRHD